MFLQLEILHRSSKTLKKAVNLHGKFKYTVLRLHEKPKSAEKYGFFNGIKPPKVVEYYRLWTLL